MYLVQLGRRPRARGGPPHGTQPGDLDELSSPRTRGSSRRPRGAHREDRVVPAHAGVLRCSGRSPRGCSCRPRARGGPPARVAASDLVELSSPRTRGSSRLRTGGQRRRLVVPAHAGVLRCCCCASTPSPGRPRARGGPPVFRDTLDMGTVSSPRTRGSSPDPAGPPSVTFVVPAHAGVLPGRTSRSRRPRSRPRARGCPPMRPSPVGVANGSSPRTRGSSVRPDPRHRPAGVVPAHAGVLPRRSPPRTWTSGRPRARGGPPPRYRPRDAGTASSPRTRGSSPHFEGEASGLVVVPAHAGVLRGAQRAAARRVVPAHAGVLRAAGTATPAPGGRPRARGGPPHTSRVKLPASWSSPRTRGSPLTAAAGSTGVLARRRPRPGRPRARGGPPVMLPAMPDIGVSSPRTRGSSVAVPLAPAVTAVVPAHAGVLPSPTWRCGAAACRPPRTRGSSHRRRLDRRHLEVVPAHAGVLRPL